MSRFKPQLDKPKDGFGPCRFVALFSCPGVHPFTRFGRKTDGRYGIMPGGATAFLCTRGHIRDGHQFIVRPFKPFTGKPRSSVNMPSRFVRPIMARTASTRMRDARHGTLRFMRAFDSGKVPSSGLTRRLTKVSGSAARSASPDSRAEKPTRLEPRFPMRACRECSCVKRSISAATHEKVE